MLLIIKSHPVIQAASHEKKPEDLTEIDNGLRRNPGEPDADQSRDGEYKKPLVSWRGLTIAIENPAGSVRRGRSRRSGVTWEQRMLYDYGEIVGTLGVDGDPVDVFLGPDPDAPMVYVVHQRRFNDWKQYDEDKCMVGFSSEEDAKAAFLSCYSDPRFLGPITAMPVDEFVAKVRATKDSPAMIKSSRGPIHAPKGGAISHLNGEFYEGGQFMATQFDMPKSYKKKIKAVIVKAGSKNIAELKAERGASGQFNVWKRMAGESRKEIVFSGTEEQAKRFMDELVEEKSAESARRGLAPHPTEVSMVKSDFGTLSLMFLKARVGPYMRGGKLVNLSGYDGRSARGGKAPGQMDLFRPVPAPAPARPNPYKDKHPDLDTPDLFTGLTWREAGGDDVVEPRGELIDEHRRLVAVLRSKSHEDDLQEARRQEEELRGYEAGTKPADEPGQTDIDQLISHIPGAKWRRGKGMIEGHYGIEVGGDIIGGYHETPEKAVSAARAELEDRDRRDEASKRRDASLAELKGRLESGGDVTDADLALLGLRPGGSDLKWFIPAAAGLLGVSSRSIRPKIKHLIKTGHTDMGAKRERVAPKRALRALFGLDSESDPYSGIEVRPGTRAAQLAAGRDAVQEIERAVGRMKSDGKSAQLLGAQIPREFRANGGAELVGREAKSPLQIAQIAQVYRDPRFETFRVVFVRDGRVVAENACSTRMPGSVYLPNDMSLQIKKDMEASGADGYYLIHNHPSGASMPSDADITLTKRIASQAPGFIAHVVIDHKEYSTIDRDGMTKTIEDSELKGIDYRANPGREHPLLGIPITGAKDAAIMAKVLHSLAHVDDDTGVMVITHGGASKVAAVFSVPIGAFVSPKSTLLKSWIRSVGRRAGAGSHVLLVASGDAVRRNLSRMSALVRNSSITDVISHDGESLVQKMFLYGSGDGPFSPRMPARSSVLVTRRKVSES